MKRRVQGWAAAILVSSIVWSGEVLALTQAQIIEKLKPVVLFTVATADGKPLLSLPPDGSKGPLVAGVYFSPQDAEAFVAAFKKKDAARGGQLRVQPVSLGNLYRLRLESRGTEEEVTLAFFANRTEVEWALSLLQAAGRKPEDLQGAPLFAATVNAGKKQYLTLQQNNRTVVPVYFTKQEMTAFIDRYRRQQANANVPVTVEVLDLEGILEALQEPTDSQTKKVMLVTPKAALDYARTQSGSPIPTVQPPKSPPAEGLAPTPDPH
ncbi:Tic22 family protein [Gloeobacter violaceus]|uniref:Glr3613 protein n=1 Tax=Gloeobacter violaceus (strain ATCC 29082 / PCC 7421) TaxID=251221 RepID=Q7NFB3_GLOVI|nr:Tic22 family protein [Gloeobacter violaceus]BAC91554.1 glr3613 [Gloeobacter violaceus PCC 7421]